MNTYTKLWKNHLNRTLGKALFVLPILAMVLSFGLDASVSEARFVDLSVAEERRIVQQEITKLKNDPNVTAIKSNPDLTRIQKEIVNANPNVLWFEDGRHDYFLRPIQEMTRSDDDGSSFNLGDGYIFINTADLRYINGIYPAMSGRPNNPWNIYNNSELAFVIAHEIGHWKNTEKARCSAEERISYENSADRASLELTEGTAFYGYGGELIEMSRNISTADVQDLKNDKNHASPQTRFNATADYVSRASNGRIKIDIKGNCTYDGKPIFLANKSKQVPFHANSPVIDVIQEERTMYVAGQIAFAIKYGVWNEKNLIVTTHDQVFGTKGWDFVVLAVKNPKSGGIKVIDKFLIKKDRSVEIIAGIMNKDAKVIKSLNDEERYFAQLLIYAMKN